jgi:hypothetical protein
VNALDRQVLHALSKRRARGLTLRLSGPSPSSASRAKRLPGEVRSAQTLELMSSIRRLSVDALYLTFPIWAVFLLFALLNVLPRGAQTASEPIIFLGALAIHRGNAHLSYRTRPGRQDASVPGVLRALCRCHVCRRVGRARHIWVRQVSCCEVACCHPARGTPHSRMMREP